MNENRIDGVMPILALRGLAVFPEQTIHFEVGRKKSIAAIKAAMANGSITGSVRPAPVPVNRVSGRIWFPVPGIFPGEQKNVVKTVENSAFFPLYRFFRASPL